jgi:hypothetical protein
MLVIESVLDVGFVTTANRRHPDGWTVPKGGVFVFPRGLVHYKRSADEAPAMAPWPSWRWTASSSARSRPPRRCWCAGWQTDAGAVERIKSKFPST